LRPLTSALTHQPQLRALLDSCGDSAREIAGARMRSASISLHDRPLIISFDPQ